MVIISPSSKIDGIPISFWCDEVLCLQLVLWPFFFVFVPICFVWVGPGSHVSCLVSSVRHRSERDFVCLSGVSITQQQ